MAIVAYQKVLDVEPENLVALRALEALYEKTSQYDKYLGVLESQLRISAGDGERISLYERIAATHEERFANLPRAAAAYEQIIEIDPRNYAAYHLLARLYQQIGNHEALVETHKKHIASTTDAATRIELYVAMGQVYATRLQDLDRAIEAYTDALALDPSEPNALAALADLYEKLGEWDHAVTMLGRVVQGSDDARKPELYWRMGRIQYKELGEPGTAEASLLRGLALAPEHVPTMEALIEQYSDRGDWLKAAEMMKRAETHARVAVDKVRLLCDAANIHLYKLRAVDQARQLYAAAIALDPEHVETARSARCPLLRGRRVEGAVAGDRHALSQGRSAARRSEAAPRAALPRRALRRRARRASQGARLLQDRERPRRDAPADAASVARTCCSR